MKKAIENLIGEMEGKITGYAVLMNYRQMNLCVKAEPVALLSVSVEDDEGESYGIEDVASVMHPNDYQLEIVPEDPKMIFFICKGLLESHPELKQEVVNADENSRINMNNEPEQHIICTAPEVDDDRHDLLLEGAKVFYDDCKTKMEATYTAYSAKLAQTVVGLPESEIEEAKDALESSYNTYTEMADTYNENKVKEIEEAYQKWQAKQKAKADAEAEKAAARGKGKDFGLKMNRETFEENEE